MEKIHISRCYCEIPKVTLTELVRKHFVEGIPTTTLMKEMHSREERENVATVALLDVDQDELIENVRMDKPEKLNHLLSCHAQAKKILAKEGFSIP